MRNLIYVNMMRLKKSRIFRAGVAVSMAYVAFLLFMNYQEMTDSPETVIGQLNWYFLSTLPVASAFCSVFCGMFLGTEYSDGTMRNKLMVGHTRRGIYIANLLTVFLANAFVYLAGCLVTAVMGTAMFGWNLANPMQLAFRMFSGILMLGAYAGIFTLLSMLIARPFPQLSAWYRMLCCFWVRRFCRRQYSAITTERHSTICQASLSGHCWSFYMIFFQWDRSFRFRVSSFICTGSRYIPSSALP